MAFSSRAQVVRTYGRHKKRTIAAWISPEATTKAQHVFSSPENLSFTDATVGSTTNHSGALTNSIDKSSSPHTDEEWFPNKKAQHKVTTALREKNVKSSQARKKPVPRKGTAKKQPVNGKENRAQLPSETVKGLPPKARGKRVTKLSRKQKAAADASSSCQQDRVVEETKQRSCRAKSALARFDLIHSPIERNLSSSSKRGWRDSSDLTFDASCDLFEYSADVSNSGSCATDKPARRNPQGASSDDSVFGSPEVFPPSREKTCNHSHVNASTPNDMRTCTNKSLGIDLWTRRVTRSSHQNIEITRNCSINRARHVETESPVLIPVQNATQRDGDGHRANCGCSSCKTGELQSMDLIDLTNDISVLGLNGINRAEGRPQLFNSNDSSLDLVISPCSVVIAPLSGDDLRRHSSSSALSCQRGKPTVSEEVENEVETLVRKGTFTTPNCSKNLLLSDSYCLRFKDALTPVKSKATGRFITARQKVLQQCDQACPVPFSQGIPRAMMEGCIKIGEGVYGEVFRTVNPQGHTVVLKIVPIEGDFQVNGEQQKSFEEILPEIVISRELSALNEVEGGQSATGGFIAVSGVSCCQGRYPETLLDRWDEYRCRKESENDRPDCFPKDQLFIVFEFADGGVDLENKKLETVHQAVSIFQQVALSLAVAEQSLAFEHRDLHWGNVLVLPTPRKQLSFLLEGEEVRVVSHGVQAGIIDFTLSRLEKDGCTVYCDLSTDETLFTGRGDLQFDVYRKMQSENRYG
ncbi:uncharacterized protein LOC110983366 isoform X2 [Acanthaster planci]|uniref:Uncharacterized protein LOC110983366 isoform X2 n=1 Tax=Acanthaster planci TaxID=133434 RepID=A0A8B7Z0G8_ACAPL|nr:uncharacterized protein LOC110983366 isoform X2 [Acanthaster planci]